MSSMSAPIPPVATPAQPLPAEHTPLLRGLGSPIRRVATFGAVVLAMLHIYMNTLGTWSEPWVNIIHFGGFGALCALTFPAWHATTQAAAGAGA